MWKALLVAALIALIATIASADIRRLMQAKGYSPSFGGGECVGACGGFISSQDEISEPVSPNVGCTFPATFPCTMG